MGGRAEFYALTSERTLLSHAYHFGTDLGASPDDFTSAPNRTMAMTLSEMRAEGVPIERALVVSRLGHVADQFRSDGGVTAFLEGLAELAGPANLDYHARSVAAAAKRRRVDEVLRLQREALHRGDDVEDVCVHARRALEPIAGTRQIGAMPFALVQIAAVPDLGDVRWLVDKLWAAEACGVIGGRPKAGKSWLALELGVSVASGTPALGCFAVDPGRVIHFNAEDKPGRTKERVRRICEAKNVALSAIDFNVIDIPRFALDDAEHVARMRTTIAIWRPKLLILDPLRRLHRGDEDKAGDMDLLLDILRGWQREFGCSIIVVHHIKKVEGDADGQALRGSSVLHSWLDSALYVTHKSADKSWDDPRRVDVEQRDSENIDAFEWRLTKIGGDGILLHIEAEEEDHVIAKV
jgi:hypothetical protein